MMGRLAGSGSTSRPTSSYVCRHGRVHNTNNGYNSNINNSQNTAPLANNQALGMSQQPLIQPQQQGILPPSGQATNMDQIAGVGFMSTQEYSTPVPSLGNQGYTTPSLVNNQGYTTPSLVNNQVYTTPSLVNNQGYTTPSLVSNQGYTTPSLVNNSGTGYAGVQYQPQAYQAVQYVPNAGHVQTQSVFPS